MAFVLIGALVVLFLVSMRFGVDTRPGERERSERWVATPRAEYR
jgi:hypothetical protein